MLAKYINENTIITDRSRITLEDKLIINPTDEQLKAAGYLELIDADCEFNAAVSYEIIDDKIVASYTPIEETAEAKPTSDDALNEFITTLASSETTSIAKIRAAAQRFLDNTTEEK